MRSSRAEGAGVVERGLTARGRALSDVAAVPALSESGVRWAARAAETAPWLLLLARRSRRSLLFLSAGAIAAVSTL